MTPGEAEILSTGGAAWVREMSGYEGGGVDLVEVHYEENVLYDTLFIGDVPQIQAPQITLSPDLHPLEGWAQYGTLRA